MQIYKFGGTSLGNASRLNTVKDIIDDGKQKILVLSANGKATDHLLKLIDHLKNKNFGGAFDEKQNLLRYYIKLAEELFITSKALAAAQHFIHVSFIKIQRHFDDPISMTTRNYIIAQGEILSAKLCSMYFEENGLQNSLLHAPDIIVKNQDGQVNFESVQNKLQARLAENDNPELVITQGFICSDHQGNIDNLGRGGSDYSATIFGQASMASVIQIWSDVDGFLNNDPACVNNSSALEHLSFDEAAELAYFGARILHPMSLYPAKIAEIPVLLKNTFNPSAKGTIISNQKSEGGIKAVAAKDGITSITIHSGRMLMAYGFLKTIFEIFENYKTPVDMVTTSEVSVSVTIDNTARLKEILEDLNALGEVEYTTNQSIICVVGDNLTENQGRVARIFASVDHIPVGMISYGAAKNSITFLVDTNHKIESLRALQNILPINAQKKHYHA